MATINHVRCVQRQTQLRQAAERSPGERVYMPSQQTLDRLADQTRDQGWSLGRRNLCTGCYQYKSVNGACGC